MLHLLYHLVMDTPAFPPINGFSRDKEREKGWIRAVMSTTAIHSYGMSSGDAQEEDALSASPLCDKSMTVQHSSVSPPRAPSPPLPLVRRDLPQLFTPAEVDASQASEAAKTDGGYEGGGSEGEQRDGGEGEGMGLQVRGQL